MSRFTTFGLTILLAFAPAALAVDGTILINQSTITNGLTGCPTGGHFPIIICQSGSYRLSGNITVPDANTDGIHIDADTATLDLNGFAILGPVTCKPSTYPVQCSTTGTGVGIFSLNNNTSVSNGTISGMGRSGIQLFGIGARIDGLRVSNNAGLCPANVNCDFSQSGDGIVAFNAIITNCNVTTNAGHGILALRAGTVNLNTVSFNGGIGIVNVSGGLVANNNSVHDNGQDGMKFVGLAVNNNIFGNVGFGFNCGGTACNFESNVFFNNGGTVSGGTSLGHNSCNGTVC